MCIEKLEVYCISQRRQKSSKSEGFCCNVWHWVKQNVRMTANLHGAGTQKTTVWHKIICEECCNGMVKILESRLLRCATFRLVYKNQHFGRACCLHSSGVSLNAGGYFIKKLFSFIGS